MPDAARKLLDDVVRDLAPRDAENRLVPRIVDGSAPRAVFTAIAGQELQIVPSDWRSLLALATRAATPAVRRWFAGVAAGEEAALDRLSSLARATGVEPDRLPDPLPGCQAYPSYLCWLALNAAPAEAVVALATNFGAWGRYCADAARGMRAHYGFGDDACGFFDLFATPLPDDDAVAAVEAGLAAGELDAGRARGYARLFQDYELMFWNTLAEG